MITINRYEFICINNINLKKVKKPPHKHEQLDLLNRNYWTRLFKQVLNPKILYNGQKEMSPVTSGTIANKPHQLLK